MISSRFRVETGGATHQGCVRDHNEDSFLLLPEAGVWVVADGMGGHEAGDFASQTITAQIATLGLPNSAADLEARFMSKLGAAHATIAEQSQRLGGATIGATLVALLIHEEVFACVWEGDSRLYLLRNNNFQQVSEDHTEVQELLRRGVITAEQAQNWPRRNVITRALGVSEAPNTEMRYGPIGPHDVFLLCSDGLTEHVTDHEMARVLLSQAPQQACDTLVQLTLSRGARDNVTVVVVRCHPEAGVMQGNDDPWGAVG